MRAALCTHPKVTMIADIIGASETVGRRLSTGFSGPLSEIVTSDVTRDVTLASLLRVWSATNEHTDDGIWRNATLKTIDQAAGVPGFGEAMQRAGWAVVDTEARTVTMPNFLENNAPAKNNARSTAAERQARYRENQRKKRDVTRDVTVSVTSNAREEKRRVTPIVPKGPRDFLQTAPKGFAEFWQTWPSGPRKAAGAKCLEVWRQKQYEQDAPVILAHVAAMKTSRQWQDGYDPAPLVYLRNAAWVGAEPVPEKSNRLPI